MDIPLRPLLVVGPNLRLPPKQAVNSRTPIALAIRRAFGFSYHPAHVSRILKACGCLSPEGLVLWDRTPIHRSRVVKNFLAAAPSARVHLEHLPAYAPELNPDEGIWNYLKPMELRKIRRSSLTQLRGELRLAKERLMHKSRVILGGIRQPGLV